MNKIGNKFGIYCYDGLFILLLEMVILSMHFVAEVDNSIQRFHDIYMLVIHASFDVSVIWLLCGCLTLLRRKETYFISFIVCLFWSLVNVIYSRFFGQYVSLSVLCMSLGNFGGTWWIDFVGTAFRWIDIIWFFYICLFWLVCYKIRQDNSRTSISFSLGFPLGLVALYCFVCNPLFSAIKSKGTNIYCITETDRFGDEFYRLYSTIPSRLPFNYGIVCSQIIGPLLSSGGYNLEDDEISQIKESIIKSQFAAYDSVMTTNRHRNIVFILFESLLSETSDLVVDGTEVTPYMNTLRHQYGTYYNGNIKQNISIGESSDGQFIYWTGLLPLKSEITISHVVDNRYICLPNLLKSDLNAVTSIVLPTNKSFWSQSSLDLIYGIDYEYEALPFDNDGNKNSMSFSNDSIVFSVAKTQFQDSILNFMAVLTVSTHSPYNELKEELKGGLVFNSTEYSIEYNNYLTACHYADCQLGSFIEYFKNKGAYENTVFIIASDHAPHVDFLNMKPDLESNLMLPFYIVNADIDLGSVYYGVANQIDIFPTLIDMFGIKSSWRGLGRSLLYADYYEDMQNEETQHISEMIIKSRWFDEREKL